jgi:hypothetical protein
MQADQLRSIIAILYSTTIWLIILSIDTDQDDARSTAEISTAQLSILAVGTGPAFDRSLHLLARQDLRLEKLIWEGAEVVSTSGRALRSSCLRTASHGHIYLSH